MPKRNALRKVCDYQVRVDWVYLKYERLVHPSTMVLLCYYAKLVGTIVVTDSSYAKRDWFLK